ncbi:MAG: MarR family transcriptional regulator [Actinobacteria bacterium]|nr:MarR family transcriptional regulator [Actinomycetota bacterium]
MDDAEQQAWRSLISGMTALERRLERELSERFDITMDDYAILVLLSEASDRRVRMSQVSSRALIPKPQVTYRIGRLEQRGIVERVPCEDDARGMWAVLTDDGFALLREAAELHVRNVRELVLDQMSREQFLDLGRSMQAVYRASAGDEAAAAYRA